METSTPRIPLDSFWNTVVANVDNEKMTDASFREFIRNTVPFVVASPASSQQNTTTNQGTSQNAQERKDRLVKGLDIIEESVKGVFNVAKRAISQ